MGQFLFQTMLESRRFQVIHRGKIEGVQECGEQKTKRLAFVTIAAGARLVFQKPDCIVGRHLQCANRPVPCHTLMTRIKMLYNATRQQASTPIVHPLFRYEHDDEGVFVWKQSYHTGNKVTISKASPRFAQSHKWFQISEYS